MTQGSDMSAPLTCPCCAAQGELTPLGVCSDCAAKGETQLFKEHLDRKKKELSDERLKIAIREAGMSYEDIEKEAIQDIIDNGFHGRLSDQL